MTGWMDCSPHLPVKVPITIGIMLNFNGDRHGEGHGDVTCKQTFTTNIRQKRTDLFASNFYSYNEHPLTTSSFHCIFLFVVSRTQLKICRFRQITWKRWFRGWFVCCKSLKKLTVNQNMFLRTKFFIVSWIFLCFFLDGERGLKHIQPLLSTNRLYSLLWAVCW